MIDHVILTVSDFARSVACLYVEALKPLGIHKLCRLRGPRLDIPDLKGFW